MTRCARNRDLPCSGMLPIGHVNTLSSLFAGIGGLWGESISFISKNIDTSNRDIQKVFHHVLVCLGTYYTANTIL